VRIVLVHGVATTSRVWRDVAPLLPGEVVAVDRPASGDLDVEVAHLAALCSGAVVVGVSGGATLGYEIVSRGVPVAAAVLHEPAAGSLAPGLLTHVDQAFTANGRVEDFGAALYGPRWSVSESDADSSMVAAEFAMFRAFEPASLGDAAGRVLLTTGSLSPVARRNSVERLSDYSGAPTAVVTGCSHAAHLEAPEAFAMLISDMVARATAPPPHV